jgi:hypothetical protein
MINYKDSETSDMSDEIKNALRLARAFGGMAYEANNVANGYQFGGVPTTNMSAQPNPAAFVANPALSNASQPPVPPFNPTPVSGGMNALNTPMNHYDTQSMGYADGGVVSDHEIQELLDFPLGRYSEGGAVEEALEKTHGEHAIPFHQAIARSGYADGGPISDAEIQELLDFPLGRHGYATDGAVEGDVAFAPDDKQFEKSGSVMAEEAPPVMPEAEASLIQHSHSWEHLPLRPYGTRYNEETHNFNTPESKDIGFYGPVSVGDGDHVASEYSRGSDIGQYPSIAADMPEDLKVQALNAARFNAPVPEEADKFAYNKAAERKAAGRSPFYEPGKDPYPKWSPDQYWEKPAIMPNNTDALNIANKAVEAKPYGQFGLLPLTQDEKGVHYTPGAGSMVEFVKHAFTPKISPAEIAHGAYEMIKGIPKSVKRGVETAHRAWPVALGGEGTFDPNNPEDFAGAQDLAGLAMTGSIGGTKPAGALASGLSREAREPYSRVHNPAGFYSHAAESAHNLPQEVGTPQQFRSMLEKAGVKPEEFHWSGFDEKFKDQPKINRQDVVRHFEENMPQVEESLYGYNTDIEKSLNNIQAKIDALHEKYFRNSTEEEMSLKDFVAENSRLMQEKNEMYEHGLNMRQESRYSGPDYNMPGIENYREMVLHLPHEPDERSFWEWFDPKTQTSKKYAMEAEAKATAPEGAVINRQEFFSSPKYKSGHWDDPNPLVHLRMGERTGNDGERLFHLDELQSDWGQEGRKRGFSKGPIKKDELDFEAIPLEQIDPEMRERAEQWRMENNIPLEAPYYRHRLKGAENWNYSFKPLTKDEAHKIATSTTDEWSTYGIRNRAERNAISTAPYISSPDSKASTSWVDLGLKRALHEAARNNFDRMVWTPGEEHYKRWGTEGLKWTKNPDGGFSVQARQHLRPHEVESFLNPGEEDIVDAAYGVSNKDDLRDLVSEKLDHLNESEINKLVDRAWDRMQTEESGHTLPRKEGIEGFYNKQVPQQLSKIIKKIDPEAKIEMVPIKAAANDFVSGDMIMDNLPQTMNLSEAERTQWWRDLTQNEREALFDKFRQKDTMVPSVKMTPKLKEFFAKGAPAYKKGGYVSPKNQDALKIANRVR